MLLRAAKSRSKTEDPEQAKLKAKAKEMQRVEMEELRQREANATALQAIGPRKKPRLDGEVSGTSQVRNLFYYKQCRVQTFCLLSIETQIKEFEVIGLVIIFSSIDCILLDSKNTEDYLKIQ